MGPLATAAWPACCPSSCSCCRRVRGAAGSSAGVSRPALGSLPFDFRPLQGGGQVTGVSTQHVRRRHVKGTAPERPKPYMLAGLPCYGVAQTLIGGRLSHPVLQRLGLAACAAPGVWGLDYRADRWLLTPYRCQSPGYCFWVDQEPAAPSFAPSTLLPATLLLLSSTWPAFPLLEPPQTCQPKLVSPQTLCKRHSIGWIVSSPASCTLGWLICTAPRTMPGGYIRTVRCHETLRTSAGAPSLPPWPASCCST